MTSQMRKAAVSVPPNIVEIAFGSLRELHYQLGLSRRLGYSDEHDISECESKIVETEKILGALVRSMRKN